MSKRILVAFIALVGPFWPLSSAPAATAPLPALAPARVIALAPGGVKADTLDPALREVLPSLAAAALESGAGYEVSTHPDGAGWEMKLAVTGRGPWRLSAQLKPLGQDVRLPRITTRKHPFAGREELTVAIDGLAAEIHSKVRSAVKGAGAGTANGAPIPLATSLSSSTKAVDAYLAALGAMGSGDIARARVLLDEALGADASFCLAAIERAYLDITEGSLAGGGTSEGRKALGASMPAPGSCRTPGTADAARGFALLSHGDVDGALQSTDAPGSGATHERWKRVIRGLAMAKGGRIRESVDDWRAVTAAGREDPRGLMWLGLASMATGDFPGAAEAFGAARARWPGLLQAYTLQAEAQARTREPALARKTLQEMKSWMTSQSRLPDADEHNPDLMLGSVDLLEGHTIAALKKFEAGLDALEKTAAPPKVIDTLHNAIIEMRRDLIMSRDPVAWKREVQDAQEAIDRYESSQKPGHRIEHPWELARLRGLITVREGKTIDAWKTVEEIKSHAGEPDYSEYHEAYLSAALMLKEGDEKGSTAQFERAARARGRIVDLVDLAQMQGNIRQYKESHDTYEEIARRLGRYDPSPGPVPGPLGELVLCDPHLAAMIPIYHYTWARLAYETNNPTESRQQFNRMLKYLREPDEDLMPLVKEAFDRGARPE